MHLFYFLWGLYGAGTAFSLVGSSILKIFGRYYLILHEKEFFNLIIGTFPRWVSHDHKYIYLSQLFDLPNFIYS